VVLTSASCGGSTPPSTPGSGSGSSSPTTVTGSEKIAWDQQASDASRLDHYRYVGYVDDVRQVLANATCGRTPVGTVFPCTASLPQMTPGSHRLELAVEEIDGLQLQSQRSPALLLNVVPRTAAAAVSVPPHVDMTLDGVQFVVETLATKLIAPSALAAAPDGRVFIAARDGRILVWQKGSIIPTPALQLDDVARDGDVGLIGIALDPEFASNGVVLVAYAARDRNGSFVNRIVRLRDVNSTFGQAATILEDDTASAPRRPPRIRVAADHTVYVAFPSGDHETGESFASYAGKILRMNEDGTTPRDNRGATPIISSDDATVGGFDRQPATGRLWLAGRDGQGRDFLRDLLAGPGSAVTFDSQVDPSGLVFYPGASSRSGGFAGDAFIPALTGRHLRRVRFSETDPSRIAATERLLDGEYGRISDVAVGPNGALYLCTSNAGTTTAARDDDRLLRVTASN
jgi:glucose/arabinose dehydrogenase